jgi:hypothetical protein
MKLRNKTRLTAAVSSGILLSLLFLDAEAFATEVEVLPESNCHTRLLVDYQKSLREMRPIHRLPRTSDPFVPSRLSFGPGRLRMNEIGDSALPGPRDVGFELSVVPKAGLGPVELDWHVVSQLALVKRSGAVAKELRLKRTNIGRLRADGSEGVDLTLTAPRRSGFYRVQTSFFDAAGRRLGGYAEYFRILRRRGEFRASVSPRHLHGGDVLTSRVESSGTLPILFGNFFAIDRFEGGEWQLDPMTPRGFAGVAYAMYPGLANECMKVRLPLDVAPGHYRFRRGVGVSGRRSHQLASDFHVVP